MNHKNSHFPSFTNDKTAENQFRGVLNQTKALQKYDSTFSRSLASGT
jgi:hypothetical protein